ncbi:unnamed protein product [Caretta caretta]
MNETRELLGTTDEFKDVNAEINILKKLSRSVSKVPIMVGADMQTGNPREEDMVAASNLGEPVKNTTSQDPVPANHKRAGTKLTLHLVHQEQSTFAI